MPVIPDQVSQTGESSKSVGKHKPAKQATKKPLDTRVNIGRAFGAWRSLKKAKGLQTDPEVAKYLLDLKSSSSPDLPSTEPKGEKKFSQSEVQSLVEKEVQSAVKRKEMELQGLIDNIKEINHEADFESLMQKLQARIDNVSRKADKAFAYLTASQNKCPCPADITRKDPDNRSVETSSHTETLDVKTTKTGEIKHIIDKIRGALEKLHSEKDVLLASVSGLNAEAYPPFLTPYGSSKLKKCPDVKTPEKEDPQQDDETETFEPKAKKIKTEPLEKTSPVEMEQTSCQIVKKETQTEETLEEFDKPEDNLFKIKADPECSSATEGNDGSSDQELLSYPPLPPVPFPLFLSIEAASYSIPQKVEVNLALIRNPTRLSVLWNVTEVDPGAPPMESYTIFLTMEKVKGSGIFSDWLTYNRVEAKALPMCALIKKYKPGHKVCAAVLGKDAFGRYGPYSEVVAATIPE
ncbi:Activating transcription factor 7-interacting protein 1 [Oryzias melastigma]|uniref:Activating transcription factor 7-interacting protein 1 n=1 Tax=Oryzias melastigma TaxID=30732 RepID=A0A834CAQ1_ORYME|nr:Activating transcription factor 7-interacting protein 1 [Oryzias melastigma]